MMQGPDFSIFKKVGWLAATPPAFREAVLARCDVVQVAQGKALYQVGDDVGGIYGLIEGRIEVHIGPRSSSPTLIHLVGPGFWTGEFAAITGGRRIISLVARTDCRVLRLSRAELLRIADVQPQCWQMMAMLAVCNNATAIDLIEALKREDPVERIALTLINLAREVSSVPTVVEVSQADLGALCRVSRGSVSTALRKMSQRGLIVQDYGAIRIPDLEALNDFVLGC